MKKALFTVKDLERLKRERKIKGYSFARKSEEPVEPKGKIVARHFKRKSKAKDYIAWNLLFWCNEKAVTLEEEYKFSEDRNFRSDWAIPAFKILIEYEGLFSEKSGHTTVTGYTKDAGKYNLAAQLGWKVLRFTALNYESLVTELNKSI